MTNRFGISFLFLAALSTSPLAFGQATWVVDEDGAGSAVDCGAATPAFTTIQAAVNAAAPGDTIFVCPGVYDEQVRIATSGLVLRGAGMGATTLRPSAVAPTTTALLTPLPVPVSAIVLVDGAANVSLRDLTIDGGAADGGASLQLTCGFTPHYTGVFYRNGSGTIAATRVANITSATKCAFAIRMESTSATVLDAIGNLVENYGFGITCAGTLVDCIVQDNVVRGEGPVNDRIQAGIMIRLGASAEISGNIITDHWYSPGHGTPSFSVGILLIAADPRTNPHLLRDNTFSGNQLDVQRLYSEAAL